MKYFHVILKWLAKGCSVVHRMLNTTGAGIFFWYYLLLLGIFGIRFFTHFLATEENNARALPQVGMEREREREGGQRGREGTLFLSSLHSASASPCGVYPTRWPPCALEWQAKGSSSTSSRYFLLEEFCLYGRCSSCSCSSYLLLPLLHLPASHPTSRT